jgi:signal peptidase II
MASVGLVVIAIDQLTKAWATGLPLCSGVTKQRTFDFCLAYNQGMAFSTGWGAGPLIAVAVVLVVGALIVFARQVSPATRLVIGCVIGGAIGNLLDRMFRAPAPGNPTGFLRGAVVDFLYSSFWATFNIADSAVVVGGIVLAIIMWRTPDPQVAGGARSSAGDPPAGPSDEESSPT